MLHKPTIALSRVVVTKGGQRVFDQPFHLGLNIIRGVNGSGKTTVADFIFFGLGGDTPQWRAEAAICDYVFIEVTINGLAATFRRQIEQEKFRPMAIFWGSLEQSENASAEWELYPYAATSAKESFSQVIFRAAGMPEVKGITAAKITLHQLLRLIYVDQKTDYELLFRSEIFDSPLTREAIGDLLCGIYDDRLYQVELLVTAKEAEKGKLQGELKAIFSILGAAGIADPSWLDEEKSKYLQEREAAYAELKKLPDAQTSDKNDPISNRRTQLGSELARQNEVVQEFERQIVLATTEIADRQQFIDALAKRLSALEESERTHASLGTFSFRFCPACYAPLVDDGNNCHLCKNPVEIRKGQNLLALRRELEQQVRESVQMQHQIQEQLSGTLTKLPTAKDKQRTLQLQYDEIATAVFPSIAVALSEIHRRIGYLDRTMEELERRALLAARIAAISAQQADLSSEISKLTDEIAARKAAQQEIKNQVYNVIATATLEFVRRDLPREDVFISAEHIAFDFGGNYLSVDGLRTFAASSNVYLKNVFHLALLQASLSLEYMRYPRLAIFDNVEDKGMEPIRSHNFQRLVHELSDGAEVDHQVILFTSTIEPSFESEPDILIGPSYTPDNKTLRMGAVTGASVAAE